MRTTELSTEQVEENANRKPKECDAIKKDRENSGQHVERKDTRTQYVSAVRVGPIYSDGRQMKLHLTRHVLY
jgi:hypothetical protein